MKYCNYYKENEVNLMEKKNSTKPKSPAKTATRKVIYINGSHYVCLPKKYIEQYGIKTGDEMGLFFGNPLRMFPMKEGDN
jgi:hypothetical protein